jgi:hypothetical protein
MKKSLCEDIRSKEGNSTVNSDASMLLVIFIAEV